MEGPTLRRQRERSHHARYPSPSSTSNWNSYLSVKPQVRRYLTTAAANPQLGELGAQ